MKSIIRMMMMGMVCLAMLPSLARVTIDNSSTYKPGTYSANIDAVRKYAKENNMFFLIIFGANDGSCQFCDNASEFVYGTQDFRDWITENHIAVAYADYPTANAAFNEVRRLWPSVTTFPYMFIVDGADGETDFGYFKMVAKSKVNGIYFSPFSASKLKTIVHSYIEKENDTAKVATALKVGREPVVQGLYKGYESNNLRAFQNNTSPKTRYTHTTDWYALSGKPDDGFAFSVKAIGISDSKGYGQVEFYTNKTAATAGTSPAARMALKDLAQDFVLDPDVYKTPYVRIFRADDQPADESINVKYKLELQQVAKSVPSFTQREYNVRDDAGTVEVVVRRDATAQEGRVSFEAVACELEGWEQAQEGVDFTFVNADGSTNVEHVVTFAAGDAQANIYVRIARGVPGVETPKRVFGIRLASGTQTEYTSTTVFVTDADIPDPDLPDGHRLFADGASSNVVQHLNGNDVFDSYVFTNRAATGGSLYYVSVDAQAPWNNCSPADVTVVAERYNATSGEYEEIESVALAPDRTYANLLFGSETETGLVDEGTPEVIVSIRRRVTEGFATFGYKLSWQRFDLPVVQYAPDAGGRRATPDLPKFEKLGLMADSVRTIVSANERLGTEPKFRFDIAWKTVAEAVDEAEPAVPGKDFDAVADGSCAYPATNGVDCADGPELHLLRRDGFAPTARAVKVRLQRPAGDVLHLYSLGGRSDCTFVLEADEAKPASGREAPLVLKAVAGGAGEVDWLEASGRNLSYTNAEDWIRFEANDTNEFFRITASGMTIRPETAGATVRVFTNGVLEADKALAEFPLAALTNAAPVLSFAGVTNKAVDVCVSRPAGDGVFLEYGLKIREWRPTAAGDGGSKDVADPIDDVPEGAVVVAAAELEGTGTNIVRTLNGCGTAAVGGDGGAYPLNDLADWFRFTGLVAGNRYVFGAAGVSADREVRVSFLIGGQVDTNMPLTVFADEGWIYDAESGDDVVVSVTRGDTGADVASVGYTLRAARYAWPVIGFREAEVSVDNSESFVTVAVVSENELGIPLSAEICTTNLGSRASGWEANVWGAVDPETVDCGQPGTVTNEVTVGIRKQDGWVGDWQFSVLLKADEGKCRYGTKTVTVTVRDVREQKDKDDPADDVAGGAGTVAFAAGVNATNVVAHLNGIDAGRPGAWTDTNDWYRIEGVGGNTYRFRLDRIDVKYSSDLKLFADIVIGSVMRSIELEVGGEWCELDCPEDGEILLRIHREPFKVEAPASVEYELSVERIGWPVFAMEKSGVSLDDTNAMLRVKVLRTGNVTSEDTVTVATADRTARAGVDYPAFRQTVTFPAGDEAPQEVEIALSPELDHVYTGDRAFAVTVEPGASRQAIGEIGETVVTLRDVDAEGDRNDFGDSVYGQAVTFGGIPQRTQKNAASTGESRLNGGDLVDWYRFDGIVEGSNYCFGAKADLTACRNVAPDEVHVDFFLSGDYGNPDESFTLAELMEREFRFKAGPGTTRAVYAKVWRAAGSGTVSFAYSLTYRAQVPRQVCFLTDAVTASGLADGVWVDVLMELDGESLDETVTAAVTPREDDAPGAHTAKPYANFDPASVPVTWEAETTGGVKRVRIGLSAQAGKWVGDLTFRVDLTCSEAEPCDPSSLVVMLKDPNPPAYGTVGISGYGQTAVREGDTFDVDVTRIDGAYGAVTGVWTWASGKTVLGTETRELFADRRDGPTTVSLTVPENPGYQQAQTYTLTFALKAEKKTVAITKGTPTKITLAVEDRDFAGPVSDADGGDAAALRYRTTGTDWYLMPSGAIRSATPAAGKSVVLATAVTGPGTFRFTADVPAAGATVTYAVNGGTAKQVVAGANAIAVESGTQEIVITYARAKKGAEGTVTLSGMSFERGTEAAESVGTFFGRAGVSEGGETFPGQVTLTVSTFGRVSGKILTPVRVWTFSASEAWNGDLLTVTAKSGVQPPREIQFRIDRQTGCVAGNGEGFAAELGRNRWTDRPLSEAAAAVLGDCIGYYTAVLPGTGGSGSGYLTLTVGSSGAITVAGRLADGLDVSFSSTLTLDGEGNPIAYFYESFPKASGRWIALTVRFVRNAAGQMAFANAVGDVAAIGGWYGDGSALREHYGRRFGVSVAGTMTGKDWLKVAGQDVPVTLAFDPSGAKLSLVESADGLFTVDCTQATGLFRGSVRGVYETGEDESRREIRQSFSYGGVLVPVVPEPVDYLGRGFFVDDAGHSHDIVIRGE